ncbi:MAG: hypothetical protein ABIF85_02715 [Nanoarchaeota archaeon]|nr:hypothetical protein [Nanoarchaeota archaeon]MBU4300165.1 hypothetical protein [Nanoarchaeota archaeon]MBU4452201.1 hypothetical protein [Nanoarchaeota archaeon]MCG2724371.1 hypothetical protein [archaeon]
MESHAPYKRLLENPIERQNLLLLNLSKIPKVTEEKLFAIYCLIESEFNKDGKTLGYSFNYSFGKLRCKELENDLLTLAIQRYIDYNDIRDVKET